jgi:RIO-like serine/threonine protein kinase
VVNDEGEVLALKLHRLGRTSFRAVRNKRDYVRRGSHFRWAEPTLFIDAVASMLQDSIYMPA